MNNYIKKKKEIQSYLTKKYDIDIPTINNFLIFYKKDIKEKLILYNKKELALPNFDTDTNYVDLPCYEEENIDTNHDEQINYNFPDLEFESQMRQEFDQFRSECLDDKMLDLFHNVKIDDFYRLFAPSYNPVF